MYWENTNTNDLTQEEYIRLSVDSVCYGKIKRTKNRKKVYLNYQGYDFPIHIALWNFFHPEDPVDNPLLIRFRDGKRDNLERENLVRVKLSCKQESMSEYDKDYVKFCEQALQYGKVSMSKGRRYLAYNGRSVALSRALWNLWHPDDPVKITEVIHHKDGDRLNDRYENLQKMDAGTHMKLHVEQNRSEKSRYVWTPKRREKLKQKILKEERASEKRKQKQMQKYLSKQLDWGKGPRVTTQTKKSGWYW